MSHPTNQRLYDELLDSVPRPLIEKLLSEGHSENEILNRYKTKELDKLDALATLENDEYNDNNPYGGTVERFDIIREQKLTS